MIKSELNFTNKRIDDLVNADRNMNWNKVLSNLAPVDKKFWKISKALRGKHSKAVGKLIHNGNSLFTDEEKVNCIADEFEKSRTLTMGFKHSIDGKVYRFNKQLLQDDEPNMDASTYATPTEVKSVIMKLKACKAPGVDGIQSC